MQPAVSLTNELGECDALLNVAPAPIERPHHVGVDRLGDHQRDCVGRLRPRWRAFSAAASSATAAVTGTVSQPSAKSRAAVRTLPLTRAGPTRISALVVAASTNSSSLALASASTAAWWCASSAESAAIATLASRTISRATGRGAHRDSRRGRRRCRACPLPQVDGRAAGRAPPDLRVRRAARDGLPCESAQRFVLWLRLRRVAEHAWRTRSLTEAAHAAGFSDLAHFSRVCRATFGVAPTGLLAMAPISASWPPHVERNGQVGEPHAAPSDHRQ